MGHELVFKNLGGIAADGGAPTWATVTELEETAAVADGNVGPPSLASVTVFEIRRKVRST